MIGEIAAMVSGARHAMEMVKALGTLDDQRKINEAIIPVQEVILAMQQHAMETQMRYGELAGENARLRAELEAREEWEEVRKDYEAVPLAEGLLVYQPLAGAEKPQVPVCPACFGERRISWLQRPDVNYAKLVCHACKWECNPAEHKHAMIRPVPRTRRRMADGL